MTNELGTTLQDIDAKAESKEKALTALTNLYYGCELPVFIAFPMFETIRKYIEEN